MSDITNPVAEARKRSKAGNTKATADAPVVDVVPAPKADATPAPPPPPKAAEPEVDPAPTTPEAPAPVPEAAPLYVDGAHVQSTDPRRPAGIVTGAAMKTFCYTVTPDDGTPPYMSPESETVPYVAPVEESMTDETIVPAATAEAHGLQAGATLADINAAAAKVAAELETERAEARNAALTSAGMKGDLIPLLAATVTRGEGQSWTQAVQAHKAAYPSAYAQESAPPAPAAEDAKANAEDTAPVAATVKPAVARVAHSVVRGAAPMPVADPLPAPAAASARKPKGPETPDEYRARIAASYRQ